METAWKCTHVPKPVPKHVYTSSVQGVSKLVHMLCTNLALAWAHAYISKQFLSLGTPTSTAVPPNPRDFMHTVTACTYPSSIAGSLQSVSQILMSPAKNAAGPTLDL